MKVLSIEAGREQITFRLEGAAGCAKARPWWARSRAAR